VNRFLCVFAFCLVTAICSMPAQVAKAQDTASAMFSQSDLDQMLAPIALYPDDLLSNLLTAATYPLEVVQADRFVKQNPALQGDALAAALNSQSWDQSVKALAQFPSVLAMMDDQLNWTEEVGDAFLAQPSAVMDTVQQLRIKAQENGVLESNTQQTVTSDGNIVIIQPYVADVVYVPYYDPGIVYGIWWWPNQPPVSWNPPPRYRPNAYGNIGSGGIAYGGRVVVSPAIFPRYRPNWNGHTISVGGNLRKGASQAVWQHDPAHRQGVAYRTTPSINRVATPSGTQAVVSQQRFAPERQVQQSQQAQQLQQAQPARPQNQSEFIVRQAPSPQPQRVEAPRIAAPQATSQPEPPHTSAPAAPHNETKQSNDPRKPAN